MLLFIHTVIRSSLRGPITKPPDVFEAQAWIRGKKARTITRRLQAGEPMTVHSGMALKPSAATPGPSCVSTVGRNVASYMPTVAGSIWTHATALAKPFLIRSYSLIGAIVAGYQRITARKTSENVRFTAIYSHISTHNENIYRDKYKKLAIDQFIGLTHPIDTNIDWESYWSP